MLTDPPPAPQADIHTQAVNAYARGEVDVIIAAWRASATIGRAVVSALLQPETAQVIVVDDASSDGLATVNAARAADDGSGRLKIIGLDRNGGPSSARNAAIAAGRAPWIAILDSDDFLEPGRLTALLAVAHEGYDLIADDLMQVPEGQPASAGKPMWFDGDKTPVDIDFDAFIDSNISRQSRIRRELGFLKPLVRRAFLERHRLSYDETMRLGEDYDLYARALSLGARMRLVPWAGYVSVMRRESLSLSHGRADLAALEAADDRLIAKANLNSAQQSLVRRHRFTTRSRIVWIDFMDALKQGHVFRASGIMLRDPRQAPYVLRELGKIAYRRATGKKRS
ncbi:MAG TPA: glycosyltransferase family 2 protein [Hyphomonadaceae bacterium]|nr:glycosyltransferase family 2 protein [Hyphomonadaceae bacterium]